MRLHCVLVYCHCGHHVELNADCWPDEVRLSDLEPRFVCQGCAYRSADVRPDFEHGGPIGLKPLDLPRKLRKAYQ